jgi:hypothetical protein
MQFRMMIAAETSWVELSFELLNSGPFHLFSQEKLHTCVSLPPVSTWMNYPISQGVSAVSIAAISDSNQFQSNHFVHKSLDAYAFITVTEAGETLDYFIERITIAVRRYSTRE